jgi:hypothetical protein
MNAAIDRSESARRVIGLTPNAWHRKRGNLRDEMVKSTYLSLGSIAVQTIRCRTRSFSSRPVGKGRHRGPC